jgi:small-conductance mechanosensitive channel
MKDWTEALKAFFYIWNKKLLTIQGVQLSFGNLFLGLFLLLMANRASKIVSKLITKKLILPLVEDKSVINVYQTFAFYGVLGTFVVIALTIAGIPLTIFTVIGGALAIGVGFGSQNIVNNFISGIILMIERPVKIGDVVEIDGITGTIKSIGTRSTKMKTADNKHFIIPNSFFLEKSVLNWTFANQVVRTEIQVGLAYGSPLEKIKKISLDIIQSHPLIEKTPEAKIIFDEFGDNALILRLFFWCDLEKVDTLMEVRSDVRYKLDEIFKLERIEISYPQRDVHLKTSHPLQVQITQQ